MKNPFSAIRYHSLVIDRETFPDVLEITAESEDDREIMGIKHKTMPIYGVQFHPESILTEEGIKIIENFLNLI
jgi:anthranilate synthase component 2